MESILKVPKARRTLEQVKEHKSLGQKFSRMKPRFEHLLQAKKPLTAAERKSQSRQNMTDEDREKEQAEARARMQAMREAMDDDEREECQGIQTEPERAIKCQESAKECPWVKTRA